MVVADDARRGGVRQRPAHDLARMHLGAVDRAAEQLLERQRPVAGVEEQRGEDLAGVAAQALGEVAAGRGRVGQRLAALQPGGEVAVAQLQRSEEHTSELQSLMRNPYAVFCLKKQIHIKNTKTIT